MARSPLRFVCVDLFCLFVWIYFVCVDWIVGWLVWIGSLVWIGWLVAWTRRFGLVQTKPLQPRPDKHTLDPRPAPPN